MLPPARELMARGGFEFKLPTDVVPASAAPSSVQVTLSNGNPIPNWLKFDPVAAKFSAQSVPEGAIPLEVKVSVAGRETAIVVSEDGLLR
jgi:hypothetical protein